ncbi:MAG: zinc ribbon domain-containing protein [Egibacteraceae bacterium]
MIPATRAEQRNLLELQQVDTAITRLRHRRANLPEQRTLDNHADLHRRVRFELGAARERLDRLGRGQRRHERELDMVERRYASETQRKYSGVIKAQKEFEALDAELESLLTRKSDLEDTLLEIMEQTEETESLISTLSEREAELALEVAAAAAARDEAAAGIDDELGKRATERDVVAANLPAPVRRYYDDVRARKDGVAVAELVGRTCAGCRLELTATEMQEVRERVDRGLARCEQCGRILVIP